MECHGRLQDHLSDIDGLNARDNPRLAPSHLGTVSETSCTPDLYRGLPSTASDQRTVVAYGNKLSRPPIRLAVTSENRQHRDSDLSESAG
jgi:hypothetical protein